MSAALRWLLPAVALATSGCAALNSERAQNADGLLNLLFDSPGPDLVPVEKVSQADGEVVTAHAVSVGKVLRVSGLLTKPGLPAAPLGSHVDGVLVNGKDTVIASATAEFFPRPLHRFSSRYGPRYSHYAARLPLLIQPGCTVRAVFHGAPLTACQFGALCARLCRECEAQCALHSDHHEHCRKCREACEVCANQCAAHAVELAS